MGRGPQSHDCNYGVRVRWLAIEVSGFSFLIDGGPGVVAERLWKIKEHPNQRKYPNQRAFLVPVGGYIYFVPYVMDGETIFLKTAFPHRKATQDYLKEKKRNE